MKNKKYIYLLLVLCLLSVFGCNDVFNLMDQSALDIPQGMGALSLNINDNSRTIMPNENASVNELKSYKLTFSKIAGDESIPLQPKEILADELADPIYLEAGTYSLSVIGYTDDEWTFAAAYGSASELIVINEDEVEYCTVNLSWYGAEKGGEGFFSFNITLPESCTLATMKVEPKSENATEEETYTFKNTPNPETKTEITPAGTITLKSGYYQLTFTLQKPDCSDLVWLETLHVYKGMTSNFTHVFSDDDFNKKKYTVEIFYNFKDDDDNPIVPISLEKTRAHGNTLTIPDPTWDCYNFAGWFDNAGFTGSALDLDAGVSITSNMKLYAKWQKIIITGTASISSDGPAGIFKIGSTLTADVSGIKLVLEDTEEEVNVAGNFNYQWYRDDEAIPITRSNPASTEYTISGSDVNTVISFAITHTNAYGEIIEIGDKVPYTLELNLNNLSKVTTDYVSFLDTFTSTHDDTETTALADAEVPIYFKLFGSHYTNYIEFSFATGGTSTVVIETPEETDILPGDLGSPSPYMYTVNPKDAIDGKIIIRLYSIHTNLIVLDEVSNVEFTKDGTITFTPGANNGEAGSTYVYRFYKDEVNVDGPAVNRPMSPIADDDNLTVTIPSLTEEMLSLGAGKYTVRVLALTVNEDYESESAPSDDSKEAVYVNSVTVNLTGNGTDKVTVYADGENYYDASSATVKTSATDHTASFAVNVFNGTQITLTAEPSGYRYVAWNISELVDNNNYPAAITANRTITAAFADPAITITTQPASTTNVTQNSITGTLSVTASIVPAARVDDLTYQWYQVDGDITTTLESASATTNTLTIPTDLTSNGDTAKSYGFYCIVSANGAASKTSDTATVNVAPVPRAGIELSESTNVLNNDKYTLTSINYLQSKTPLTVNVKNTGNQTISGITVTSSNTANFTVSTGTLADLSEGGTTTITVTPAAVNAGTYSAAITVAGTSGGNPVSASFDVEITINKINPIVYWPTGLTANYGQTLADVDLGTNTGTNATSGSFTWTEDDSTLVGSTGENTHNVTFTPVDIGNYNVINQNVTVTVKGPQAVTATFDPITDSFLTWSTEASYNAAEKRITIPYGSTLDITPDNSESYSSINWTLTEAGEELETSYVASFTFTPNPEYTWSETYVLYLVVTKDSTQYNRTIRITVGEKE